MTAEEFRRLALDLPETSEGEHMDHPDFRVGDRIFASLGPGEDWGMVKLTADGQASWVRQEPDVFEPFNGAWGRQGYTKVHLDDARTADVRKALFSAWRDTAPESLVRRHEKE